VIACPCALVISTPVTIVSGLAAAARHGILIKGGVYLEEGRKLAWLALDKTGTITHGKPVQTDFELRADVDAAAAWPPAWRGAPIIRCRKPSPTPQTSTGLPVRVSMRSKRCSVAGCAG
jgi:hypothetical protein